MAEPERALAVIPARSAMTVDEREVTAQGTLLLKHKGIGVFPQDMSAGQAGQIARLALAYGLDPFTGEIILYQGRPYVTIDGRVRIANDHPAFRGMTCDPATPDERKAFRARDDEHLWVARVYRDDRSFPTVGYGRCSETSDKNPVGRTWAQEQAQKRAKHRALRDAFSIPLPGAEETRHEGGANLSNWRDVVVDVDTQPYAGPYAQPYVDLEPSAPPQPPPIVPIRPEQSRAIHTLVGKLGWDDGSYRTMLRETSGVESSKELTEGQASSVLEMLHSLAEDPEGDDAQPPEDGPRYVGAEEQPTLVDAPVRTHEGVTAEQVAEITRLAPDWADGADWDGMNRASAGLILESLRARRTPAV